jgi:long-chain acyl-CoA synthetase
LRVPVGSGWHKGARTLLNRTTEMKTPLEMFYLREKENANDIFLRQSIEGGWRDYTWKEVAERVRRLAAYFYSLNFEPETRIAIFAKNCADWVICDFAIMLSGHISVPLYPGQDRDSAKYILNHSDCRLAILGEFDISRHSAEILNPDVITLGIHGCAVDTTITLDAIQESYPAFEAEPLPDPERIFTILYTSGTTGNPKGVMHRHGTPGSSIPRMQKDVMNVEIDGRHRFFSYLPMSHAMERAVVEMNALYCNGVVSFSAGMDRFFDELRDVRPTFFASVPRLWVKFKELVDSKLALDADALRAPKAAEKARQFLGLDAALRTLTGSAPCPPDVHNWFADIGLALREGYSMTENFCDGCFWSEPARPIPGCVGRPVTGVELRICDEDQEICFRSDALMSGYYLEEEKSSTVLVDGWYHTGDAGRIDEHGRLWVTGRISETFKTSKGKFIQPVELEKKLMASGLWQQICVFGHGFNQPMAFAYPSDKARGLLASEYEAEVAGFLEQMNSELPPHERVSRVLATPDEWTIQNGLLTPTLKMKRKTIQAEFESLL